MQANMDTDYCFLVPMHCPLITFNSQYDPPLPVRRLLKQVAELNAENAAPYQLPKTQRLSGFERLPYEIGERIYDHLDLVESLSAKMDPRTMVRISSSNHQRPWFNHDVYYYKLCLGLLGANRNLQEELLDVHFRKMVVKFGYPLSGKKNLCFTSELAGNDKDSYFTQGLSNTTEYHMLHMDY
jgi:hypothetical protein